MKKILIFFVILYNINAWVLCQYYTKYGEKAVGEKIALSEPGDLGEQLSVFKDVYVFYFNSAVPYKDAEVQVKITGLDNNMVLKKNMNLLNGNYKRGMTLVDIDPELRVLLNKNSRILVNADTYGIPVNLIYETDNFKKIEKLIGKNNMDWSEINKMNEEKEAEMMVAFYE